VAARSQWSTYDATQSESVGSAARHDPIPRLGAQGPQPQRQRLMVVGTRLGLDGSELDQSDSEFADLI